jgi:hypothetical protein
MLADSEPDGDPEMLGDSEPDGDMLGERLADGVTDRLADSEPDEVAEGSAPKSQNLLINGLKG